MTAADRVEDARRLVHAARIALAAAQVAEARAAEVLRAAQAALTMAEADTK